MNFYELLFSHYIVDCFIDVIGPYSAVEGFVASCHFCRAMLCKRGLSRHAVSVCLSVRLSVCVSAKFVDHVKTNKHMLKIHHQVANSHTTLVFPSQTA